MSEEEPVPETQPAGAKTDEQTDQAHVFAGLVGNLLAPVVGQLTDLGLAASQLAEEVKRLRVSDEEAAKLFRRLEASLAIMDSLVKATRQEVAMMRVGQDRLEAGQAELATRVEHLGEESSKHSRQLRKVFAALRAAGLLPEEHESEAPEATDPATRDTDRPSGDVDPPE